MKEAVKKEILYDLQEVIKIIKVKEVGDIEQLKQLSNHAIEDVALHKDLDMISVTVLIYSIYKVVQCIRDEARQKLLRQLSSAVSSLQQNNFGKYNKHIRASFRIVRQCSNKVKEHLQDVMQAARIKKGTALLEHGLSIGQAAGLMGLSNWDLQDYAGKTTSLDVHSEKVSALKRLQIAERIFGV